MRCTVCGLHVVFRFVSNSVSYSFLSYQYWMLLNFSQDLSLSRCLSVCLSGQFLVEQSRLGEAAVMAEKAAELDNTEFDVVFSAAHILRCVHVRDDAQLFDTEGRKMYWFGVIGDVWLQGHGLMEMRNIFVVL